MKRALLVILASCKMFSSDPLTYDEEIRMCHQAAWDSYDERQCQDDAREKFRDAGADARSR